MKISIIVPSLTGEVPKSVEALGERVVAKAIPVRLKIKALLAAIGV